MPEVIYYPEVRCEVFPGGLVESEVTAKVTGADNDIQFIRVTPGLINKRDGEDYLPVGFVDIDRLNRKALIEFPTEADSGANRMWVGFDDLRREVQIGEIVA